MIRNLRSGHLSRTLLWTALILGLIAIGLCATPLRHALADSIESSGEEKGGEFLLRGKWMIDVKEVDGEDEELKLTLNASNGRSSHRWTTTSLRFRDLDGIDASMFGRGQHDVTFRLLREAGTFVCRGVIEEGGGAATSRLELRPEFASELERRKIGRVTPSKQANLAFANAGLAVVDELEKQGYE